MFTTEVQLQNLNSACAIDTKISVDKEVNLLILFHFKTKVFSVYGYFLGVWESLVSTIYGLFRCLLL